jgi:hypothetical protein
MHLKLAENKKLQRASCFAIYYRTCRNQINTIGYLFIKVSTL